MYASWHLPCNNDSNAQSSSPRLVTGVSANACCTKADSKGSSCCFASSPLTPSVLVGAMPRGPRALSCVRALAGACPSGFNLLVPVGLLMDALLANDREREPSSVERLHAHTGVHLHYCGSDFVGVVCREIGCWSMTVYQFLRSTILVAFSPEVQHSIAQHTTAQLSTLPPSQFVSKGDKVRATTGDITNSKQQTCACIGIKCWREHLGAAAICGRVDTAGGLASSCANSAIWKSAW